VLGYALWEATRYTLRRDVVPVLPASAEESITVLHLSDLHLAAANQARADWVAELVGTDPDVVVATGDFLSSADGLTLVEQALAGFAGVPGAFVFGSNDYYAARRINPASYLRGPSKHTRLRQPNLPTDELRGFLTGLGWLDLNNAAGQMPLSGLTVSYRGVNDPHVRLDRYRDVAGPWPAESDLRIGVSHAPYLRVLDAMADDGADVIFAGHTHGGQICVPGYGALVTNCDLDTARASGLSRHGASWLHVSAGLGTNPNAPIRLACRPTATLLTLVGR
jgi:predicted MPP superfamily phosphohydrolase